MIFKCKNIMVRVVRKDYGEYMVNWIVATNFSRGELFIQITRWVSEISQWR
jgi:hypothetical protein